MPRLRPPMPLSMLLVYAAAETKTQDLRVCKPCALVNMLSWSSRGTGFEHQPAAVGLVSESKETVFGHMTGLGAEAVGIKQLHDTSCDSNDGSTIETL